MKSVIERIKNDDSNNTYTDATEILTWFNNNQGKIFMWIGAHTHYQVNQTYAGRSPYIYKYGMHFLNTGSMSFYHTTSSQDSLSRVFIFTEGTPTLNILQFVYKSHTVTDGIVYTPNELELTMTRNFTK